MLKSISLQFSETPDPIVLPMEGVTIFVGPNNSGKSLVLREVEMAIGGGVSFGDLKIVKDFEVFWPSESEVQSIISKITLRDPNQRIPEGQVVISYFLSNGFHSPVQLHLQYLNSIISTKSDKRSFGSYFLKFLMMRLDGRSRFSLTDERQGGDLALRATNILAHFFKETESREEARKTIYDAFKLYFVIDPTNLGSLRIRLSAKAPGNDEQSLNDDAREFYKNALNIKEASDGVQAYVGMITSVLAGQNKLLMIDEPEAFLHPPLARKLGVQLSQITCRQNGCLLASTHSSEFLMGCVQGAPSAIRVVRLEYSNGKSRGRIVDTNALNTMFKDPLMRSANVVSGLFHDGVVVTESDNDRAFYAEIYYRLTEQEATLPSVLFINAQNKQTIPRIIESLRQFGIPAAAIADIDVVKDGGSEFTRWLLAAQIPGGLHTGMAATRHSVKSCFDQSGKNMKTDGGVACLPQQDQDAANDFFDQLERYGVFTVRRGELEHWLPNLGAIGKKTDWTISALGKMGSDPADDSYLRPSDDDVWAFMRNIANWISNPGRKGSG